MRVLSFLSFWVALVICSQPVAQAQETESNSLESRIEILELKLQLAEARIAQLQRENSDLAKENAALKKADARSTAAKEQDLFEVGRVWVGESISDSKKRTNWAVSISKRDGRNFEGGIAAKADDGKKLEFPFTGKAPIGENGIVIIESPMMGRAKIFMRGTLRNRAVALVFSGTGPLGGKFFGSASLRPEN